MLFKRISDFTTRTLNFMASRPDIFCIFFAFVILLVKYKDGVDGTLETRTLITPKKLTSNGSKVVESWTGGIKLRNYYIKNKDIGLVMYYAPWCQRSIETLKEFETVAEQYYKKVYFVAINCWWGNGQCRSDMSIVKFPEIYAHHASFEKAIRYSGPFRAKNIIEFIERLFMPMSYLGTTDVFEKFVLSHQLTAVSAFNLTHSTPSDSFKNFTRISLQYISQYPKDYVQFGFVTNEQMTNKYNLQSDLIKLYDSYDAKFRQQININQSLDNAADKLEKHADNVLISRINLRDGKSDSLHQFLRKGPTLILFLPPGTTAKQLHTKIERMVKQYNSCARNPHLESISDEHLQTTFTILNNNTNGSNCYSFLSQNRSNHSFTVCNICQSSTNDKQLCVETTKLISRHIKGGDVICVDQKPAPNNSFSYCNVCCLSATNTPFPNLHIALALLRNHHNIFETENIFTTSKISRLGCLSNRTLSFIQIDSKEFNSFLDSFETKLFHINNIQCGAIIIDLENEVYYNLNEPMHELENFIVNFTFGLLPQSQKSSSMPAVETAIKELTCGQLQSKIHHTQKDVILFYYTPWCASCSTTLHKLIAFQQLVDPIDSLNIFRINGGNNDIPDSYTVSQYPTVILYLGSRFGFSKMFPNHWEISQSNLLKFVLREGSKETIQSILWNICVGQPRGSRLSHFACNKWRQM